METKPSDRDQTSAIARLNEPIVPAIVSDYMETRFIQS